MFHSIMVINNKFLFSQCLVVVFETNSLYSFQILCEVLVILNQLVRLDQNQGSQILQVVKRIQTNVTEKFKSDHRDISIFVRVLHFLLSFGELYEMCQVYNIRVVRPFNCKINCYRCCYRVQSTTFLHPVFG
jgi:hypothetical protein